MIHARLTLAQRARLAPMTRILVALAFIFAINANTLPSDTVARAGDDSTPASSTSLTVMTANLGDGLADPDSLVSFIRDQDVDLVALQEVTPDIADALAANLSDILPFQEVRGLGIPGKALLSRYPITQAEWLEDNPGRPDLHAFVEIAGHPIEVVVAHPPPPELSGGLVNPREGSTEQFERLLEIASNAEIPFLMMGDFNMISLHERHSELEGAGLQDVFSLVGSGNGFTYPERVPPLPDRLVRPFMRIDYIWASADWEAVSATVGDDIGSDHLPLVAHIELVDASGT